MRKCCCDTFHLNEMGTSQLMGTQRGAVNEVGKAVGEGRLLQVSWYPREQRYLQEGS